MSRAVLAWCRAYTAVVPEDARARRRDEIESHLWDARAAGVHRRAVVLAALRGAADDLRWCSDERRRAGLAPVVFGTAGSSAIAVALMALAYLLSIDPQDRFEWSDVVLPRIAAVVVALSLLDRVHRRFGRRRG